MLEVLGVDRLRLLQGCVRQRVMRDADYLARQAARALEQRLNGGRLGQRQLESGEPQAVGEVGVDLVAVAPGVSVADDETLGERFVHRQLPP